LKTVSGKDFARLLEKHGWELKRVTGSHHIYAKSGNPARVSVPIHGNVSLKVGLLKHLLKISDLSEDDL
jgi:predicted RNA binding protein YcfA (HicA-like mRNA interferase family)